jgi:WD40 repeat protein
MKYSPDGKFLAVGAHDDTIYIYAISAKGDYSLHTKFEYIHSSAITAMDWTLDSVYLRAIDQAYGKQFYDIVKEEQVDDEVGNLTDTALWSSLTCKLGWEVSGVFPIGTDGTDVNSVDINKNRTLVAVADDFGSLNVYRFPCIKNT